MELTPVCPYCGCNLIFFEHYDCYDEEDQAFLFADGDCPQCHREYRWIDAYKLNHFENLEEINKNEDFYS